MFELHDDTSMFDKVFVIYWLHSLAKIGHDLVSLLLGIDFTSII